MFATLRQLIDTWRSQRFSQRSRHRHALAQIPSGLYEHWRRTAGKEFEGIPTGRLFFMRAAEGLMDFFDCARRDSQPCALPSNAADSVWHAWSSLSSIGLEVFCVKQFGRTIAHVEGAAMGSNQARALATCLVRSRRLESLPPAGMALPRLFKLDGLLGMPGGFGYKIAGEQLAWHRLDRFGKPHGAMFMATALAPLALLSAGLVSHDEYLQYERRRQEDNVNDGGASSGGSASSDRDGDGNGDGGGSDGGSSCGSGCGGGGD